MRTKTLSRLADVTVSEAMTEIAETHPGSEVVSFTTQKHARTGKDMYVAKVKLAEYPPAPAPDDMLDKSDADKPKEKSEDKPEKSDDSDDDSGDGSEDDPLKLDEPGDEGDEPEAKEPKMSEVMDLMKAIADKLGVPLPGADTMEDPLLGPDADALPDSGAPIAGEPAGGPGGAPLPPPVPEKPKPGGMGSFASAHPDLQKVAARRSFLVERTDAGELNNVDLVREAHAQFPTHRVAKLDRLVKADQGVAVIAMVARNHKG